MRYAEHNGAADRAGMTAFRGIQRGQPARLLSMVVRPPEGLSDGSMVTEVIFDGEAPGLSAIADKITELSGLPLPVADGDGDLYDRGFAHYNSVAGGRSC